MQQLTERQCWKVIRQLAKAKNTEYRAVLNGLFKDIDKTIQIQGHTRDAFLRNYGIRSLDDFFAEYRQQTSSEPDTREWIDNLSSESLLIFLDFRCRVLQRIYDYLSNYKNIDKKIIQQIIDDTCLSQLAGFKANSRNGRPILAYSRKPGRTEGGEKKLRELNMSSEELYEQALAQTMGKLVGGYIYTKNETLDNAMYVASKLVTDNVKPTGERTGYCYKGMVEITPIKPMVEYKTTLQPVAPVRVKKGEKEFIGFDINGMPLYIKNGVKVDMLGVPTSAKVEYDTCHNRILKADETDTYKNDSSRLVGLDIEGCPVYECDGDYYSSTGERLPDDVYFESVDNSSFNR